MPIDEQKIYYSRQYRRYWLEVVLIDYINVSHAIIRAGIINKRNNFDRVDLVSNNKRKIGTQCWKT